MIDIVSVEVSLIAMLVSFVGVMWNIVNTNNKMKREGGVREEQLRNVQEDISQIIKRQSEMEDVFRKDFVKQFNTLNMSIQELKIEIAKIITKQELR